MRSTLDAGMVGEPGRVVAGLKSVSEDRLATARFGYGCEAASVGDREPATSTTDVRRLPPDSLANAANPSRRRAAR